MFVGSLVRSLLRQKRFLEKQKFDFHEIWYRCSASVPNVTVNFSEVKVKVQGQNRRTENLPLAITRMRFKIPSPNLASDRNDFDRGRWPLWR